MPIGHKGTHTDLTGKVFGKLTVVGFSGIKSDGGRLWSCSCACGGNKIVRASSLITGSTKSCGCSRRSSNSPLYLGCGELSGSHWAMIRQASKDRNIHLGITIKYAWELFLKQNRKCALSGEELQFGYRHPKLEYKLETTASLDRINSSGDYVYGNVQWIHKDINFMKCDFDQERFITVCHRVASIHPLPKPIVKCATVDLDRISKQEDMDDLSPVARYFGDR